MTRPNLQVNLKTYQRKWRINPASVRNYLRKAWIEICNAGVPPGSIRKAKALPVEVSIVFLNDQQMRCYNKEYRQKDYPTDVLSFPVNEIQEELAKGRRRHIFYLGDILISMERTALQAHEKGHSVQKELKILILHGVLHLLGYDHEVDNGRMDRVERRLLKKVMSNES
jgi:probable rRNA maturation factor